jgi:hypothetical protein
VYASKNLHLEGAGKDFEVAERVNRALTLAVIDSNNLYIPHGSDKNYLCHFLPDFITF